MYRKLLCVISIVTLYSNWIHREEYQEQFRELAPDTPPETFSATLGLLEWNSRQLKGFYDTLYTDGLQHAQCIGDEYVSNIKLRKQQ